MNCIHHALVAALAVGPIGAEAEPVPTTEPAQWGLTSIGRVHFPQPDGTTELAVPNGDFEELADGRPAGGWALVKATLVEGDAREGKAHVRLRAEKSARVVSPELPLEPVQPHLLSLWLRSTVTAATRFGCDSQKQDRNQNCLGGVVRSLPSTDGEWKRAGLYFLSPAAAKSARLTISCDQLVENGAIAIDDLRLRTATWDEYTKAYDGWRAQYPAYDLSPRPDDGKNLALAIHKLEGKGVPGKPFLIWAVGSSYTNMLGDGELLIPELRKRFPNAPPIIYKKHCGASSSWLHVRGWVRQFVIPDQPDLVLTYTIGKPDDLEKLIVDLRQHTTADILVPSIHWRMRDEKNWDRSENAADQDVGAVRELCRKHRVEFVESRREWQDYMKTHGFKLEIDPAGMLKDAVHQSSRGALVINENIARHFVKCATPSHRPEERERRIGIEQKGAQLATTGNWTTDANGCPVTSEKGAKLTVRFTGNGTDLIGRKSPKGGTAEIAIDALPADQAPAFATNHIVFTKRPKPDTREFRGLLSDRAPHGVQLGRNVVPQSWTIRMTSVEGDYELVGSVTGPDGTGNNKQPFTSTSGQITIPPELWRNPDFNVAGDEYQFDVWRSAVREVSFNGEPDTFCLPLVRNLPNGEHTLELICNGDGEVAWSGFHVYEPQG